MVEQQSRHEPRAALARQELERGQHLPVVAAGERREQGLEGAQVERGSAAGSSKVPSRTAERNTSR